MQAYYITTVELMDELTLDCDTKPTIAAAIIH